MSIFIHKSSFVDEGAKIGDETKIWHFSHISSGAKIGDRCSIGQNVYIANNVEIGNDVKIQNNVSVFDNVFIEDEVFCGPSMVFTNVINPRSHISRKSEYKNTFVKKGTSIGANATIVCGVTLEKYSFIGAGAVVNKNTLPFSLNVGVPSKKISWITKEGFSFQIEDNDEYFCKKTETLYKLENDVISIIE